MLIDEYCAGDPDKRDGIFDTDEVDEDVLGPRPSGLGYMDDQFVSLSAYEKMKAIFEIEVWAGVERREVSHCG